MLELQELEKIKKVVSTSEEELEFLFQLKFGLLQSAQPMWSF
jgi:hypothetical protein